MFQSSPYRLSLNVLTLKIDSNDVYTQAGVAISVTGIAQVLLNKNLTYLLYHTDIAF